MSEGERGRINEIWKVETETCKDLRNSSVLKRLSRTLGNHSIHLVCSVVLRLPQINWTWYHSII